jgi:hypothetical protein
VLQKEEVFEVLPQEEYIPKKTIKQSDALKLLLEIANFVPKDETPPIVTEVFNEIYRRKYGKERIGLLTARDPFVDEALNDSRLIIEEKIKQYSKFSNYMKQYQERAPEAWIKEYDYVLHNRKMVRELLEKIYLQPDVMERFVSLQISAITNIWVGEVIDFPQSLFEVALKGVPPERLRICPICQSIFWAARHDARACSKKCNSVRRVRILRRKEKEKSEI